MADQEYRLLFKADYSKDNADRSTNDTSDDEDESFWLKDPYLSNLSPNDLDRLIEFIDNCWGLALLNKTEISIDICEKTGEIAVFLSAASFHFRDTDLMFLSAVCSSSKSIKIISPNKGYNKTLICIEYVAKNDPWN